ncbi:MAG TPA: aldo/keto reductase, partial [Clostridiales bacterium]|nr:aldo/keto reductase [Clostridiales bacterium]
PDALVEPEEVAEAFDLLQQSGRVRHFGVSNQHPYQIQLLQKYVKQPIVTNQLQLSIAHAGLITAGINVNIRNDDAMSRDGYALDFCRLHDITIQAWSPFQHGFFGGTFLDNPDFPELNAKINEIAAAHGVSNTTIALAWLLRHPARIQPVTGTMNVTRLRDCVKAGEITLTREEWYAIYLAAGNKLP